MLPRSLSEVVAQHIPKALLMALVETNSVPKTLLFSGPSGVGKTTIARIFAATLNCPNRTEDGACGTCMSCLEITQTQSSTDVIEVDAATSGSVDEVRKLMSLSQMMTSPNTRRVIILDEALALDTPLPTPDGWTTVGAVSPGDFILGRTGAPVRVKRKTPVFAEERCYRVQFSDGTSLVASANHKWLVRRGYSNRDRQNSGTPSVRTTEELSKIKTQIFLPRPGSWAGEDKVLPVNPYLLGLWLGDGSTGQNHIHGLRADLEFYADRLATMGIETRLYETGKSADRLSFTSPFGPRNAKGGVDAQALCKSSVYRNKHIPAEYLRSSVAQREELLRGLMDTDGYVSKTDGFCTFVGTDELTSGVLELLYSLGQTARRHWVSDSRSKHGGYYKVNFKPLGGLVPVALPRKVGNVRQSACSVEWERIRSIEEVGSVPVQCIEVEAEDHLFLAGPSGRVTHNCQAMSKQAFQALLKTMETTQTTVFILVTTEPTKILETVRSRSVEIPFSEIPAAAIVSHLETAGVETEVAEDVVRHAHGSLRVAINLAHLVSVAHVSPAKLMGDRPEFLKLGEAICAGNLKASLALLEICFRDGMNQDLFITRLIEYFLENAPPQKVFQLTKILWDLRGNSWIKRDDLLRLAVTQMVAVFPANGQVSILSGELTAEKVLTALTG